MSVHQREQWRSPGDENRTTSLPRAPISNLTLFSAMTRDVETIRRTVEDIALVDGPRAFISSRPAAAHDAPGTNPHRLEHEILAPRDIRVAVVSVNRWVQTGHTL